MFFSGIIALCALGFASSAPGKLPPTFPRCHRTDPKLNECLTNAIQVAFPQLADGEKTLGLFPLDPLEIKALDIAQGTGPVAIDLKFRDLKFRNLRHAKFESMNADLDNYKIDIVARLDEPLLLDGKYEVKGNVLVLPLTGKGDAHLVLDNIKARLKLQGKESKKDGRIYMEVEKLTIDFDTSRLHMNFENLFSQEKALADNLNTFLNENWNEILKEVKPGINEAISSAFLAIASRIMSKVPYDDIFLP